jgi:hypothetical protein
MSFQGSLLEDLWFSQRAATSAENRMIYEAICLGSVLQRPTRIGVSLPTGR